MYTVQLLNPLNPDQNFVEMLKLDPGLRKMKKDLSPACLPGIIGDNWLKGCGPA
jgi:hypothetical protein